MQRTANDFDLVTGLPVWLRIIRKALTGTVFHLYIDFMAQRLRCAFFYLVTGIAATDCARDGGQRFAGAAPNLVADYAAYDRACYRADPTGLASLLNSP